MYWATFYLTLETKKAGICDGVPLTAALVKFIKPCEKAI